MKILCQQINVQGIKFVGFGLGSYNLENTIASVAVILQHIKLLKLVLVASYDTLRHRLHDGTKTFYIFLGISINADKREIQRNGVSLNKALCNELILEKLDLFFGFEVYLGSFFGSNMISRIKTYVSLIKSRHHNMIDQEQPR